MANVDTPKPPDNNKIFTALAWGAAQLWASGEMDFHEAVDWVEAKGRKLIPDADQRQAIMAAAFAEVRDDLTDR
jgi:hypothetical protein